MRFIYFRSLFWAICLPFFLCQCTKEVTPTFIPADVNAVVALDMKSLSSKAVEWKDILNTNFLQQMTGTSAKTDLLAKIMNGGIDYQQMTYVFTKIGEKTENSYAAVLFTLKDSKKFEKNLQENAREAKIKKTDGREYVLLDTGLLITWKKDKALAVLSPQFSEETLNNTAREIYNTKKENALEAKNDVFKTALQQKADAITWIDYRHIPKTVLEQLENFGLALPIQTIKPLLNVAEQVILHTNFEKGEAKTTIKTFCNQEMVKAHQKLLKGGVNADLARDIPIENPSAIGAAGLGMQGAEGLLGNSKLIQGLKILIALSGTSLGEIFGFFTGDAVIATGDMKLSNHMSEQEIVIGIGTNNIGKVTKLLADFDSFLNIKKKKDFYILDLETYGYGELFMVEKGNNLYITSSEKLKDQLVEGKIKLNTQTLALFKDNVVVGEVDYATLLKNLPAVSKHNTAVRQGISDAIGKFHFTAKPLVGNVWEAESVLSMRDKNRNALAVLFDLMKTLPDINQ